MAIEMTEQETVKRYFAGMARRDMRHSVREPMSNRIVVRLIGEPDDRAELVMTVPQALELIGTLNEEVRSFCRRRDVQESLLRTDTGMP